MTYVMGTKPDLFKYAVIAMTRVGIYYDESE
jgi:hypothetical protein